MMEQPINKSFNWKVAVDIKHLFLLSLILLLCIPVHVKGQTSCDAYYEILDTSVLSLFTSQRDQITRESAFPAAFHQPLQTQEIRRLNFPDEQWVCDAVLESIHGDDPVSPRERALYKVKDHYFLAVYSYYTDQQGNQRLNDPTAGILFDSDFNMVGLIAL